MKVVKSLILFCVILLTLTFPSTVAAQGKVVVLVVDGLEWADIDETELPSLTEIIKSGSIGLLNPISSGPRTRDNVIISLATGQPNVASADTKLIYQLDEIISEISAGDFFQSITGYEPTGELVHLGISDIILNIPGAYGHFGDVITKYNLSANFIGNADNINGEVNRQLANVVINSQGIGSSGIVNADNLLIPTDLPFWHKTNFDYLSETLAASWSNHDIFFIEIADLLRLEQNQKWLLPLVKIANKQEFLKQFDKWLGELVLSLDKEKDLLILFNPAPGMSKLAARDFLTPIIFWGQNYEEPLLSSTTTKRDGIVVNYDILPTILHHFNIFDRIGIGGTIHSHSRGQGNITTLSQLNEQLLVVYHQRPLIIKTYIFLQIIIVSLSITTIVFNFSIKTLVSAGLLLLTTVPVSLLITAPFNTSLLNIILLNILVIGFLLLLAWHNEKKQALTGFFLIFFLTSLLILFDLANNSYLMKRSILGYDPIAGARYYGLGNEFMGVLIGSSLMTIAIAYQLLSNRLKQWFCKSLFVITLIIVSFIGLPNLGTNVGGTIAAVFGFGYLLVTLNLKKANNIYYLVSAPVAVCLILFSFVIFDLNRAVETQSHLGKTAMLVKQEGITQLVHIAKGKINMNIKLIRYTNWSRVFLVMLGSLILLLYKPHGLLAEKMLSNYGLKIGVISVLIASLVALLVNDSGIVAAATMMIYGATPLFFVLLNK